MVASSPALKRLSVEQEQGLIRCAQHRAEILNHQQLPFCAEDVYSIRQGELALEQLIRANQRLVHRLVSFFQHLSPELPYEDLVQEARRAVVEAIHSFDLTKGTRLITWVFYQVRSALNSEHRQSQQALAAQSAAIAIQEVATSPSEEDPVLRDHLQALLLRLTQLQQTVICSRIAGHTFVEISQQLGKSADAVRMVFNRAITKLRSLLLGRDALAHTPPPEHEPDPLPPERSWMKRLKARWATGLHSLQQFTIPSSKFQTSSQRRASMTRPVLLAAHKTLTLKTVLLSWPVTGILATSIAAYLQEPLLQTLCLAYWVCIASTFLIHQHRPFFAQHRWLIGTYYLMLIGLYGSPAYAQAAACTSQGLLSEVTNYVSSVFSNIQFGGSTVTSLDGTICQVVGFLVFLVILSFIGVAMYVGFQVSYQQQPLSIALVPMVGFLIFAAISSIVISVMLGV